jgi:hypothetical protein
MPQAQQVKGHAPVEKQIEKPAASRAEAIEQKHLRRSAERRAKKLATARNSSTSSVVNASRGSWRLAEMSSRA